MREKTFRQRRGFSDVPMRRVQLQAVCALVLLTGLSRAGQDKPKQDQDVIQGIWEPVEQLQAVNGRYEQLVFSGDKLTFYTLTDGKPDKGESRFKLDLKASPNAIDFTPTDGGSKGKTYLGIYEISKDGQLKFWYRGPGGARPKTFDRKAKDVYFIVLKRRPAA